MSTDLSLILNEPIPWTGDLDDDCGVAWRGMNAHAEKMSENQWYCCIYRCESEAADSDDALFHTAENDLCPLNGTAARQLCELVMRLQAARDWAEQ